MDNLLNSWQFYVVIAIICEVVFVQSYKFAIEKTKNDSAATILLETIAGVTLLFFTPLFPFLIPTNPILYVFLALSILFATFQDRLKTTARRILPASEAAILNELTSAFLIIVGFTIFRQPVILTKVMGAILIFGANVLLVFKKGKFVINKATFLFTLACIFLTVSFALDIGFSTYFNIPFYIAVSYIASGTLILLASRLKLRDVSREFIPGRRRRYLITGISWGILALSIIRAAQTGPIIVVVPLMSLSVLANVLTATVVHKEKGDLLRKVIAAVVIIVGVTLTALH